MEGKKTRGCGLSLTQFVRENPPIQYNMAKLRISTFTTFLRDMMTKLEVLDTSTMQELMSIIEKFQFSLAMFKKYKEIFTRVGFHALRYLDSN